MCESHKWNSLFLRHLKTFYIDYKINFQQDEFQQEQPQCHGQDSGISQADLHRNGKWIS